MYCFFCIFPAELQTAPQTVQFSGSIILYVTGDSTKLGTYANPRGSRLCECPKDKPCTCKRRYQDLLARWGWDSYRERFIYGHSLYELCAYSLDHTVQLPLVLSLFDANPHDSVLNVAALDEAITKLLLPVKSLP